MRYLMQQKMICFGNDFVIKDENECNVYIVDGKAFSFGNQLSFQDTNKRELARISQKLLAFKPTYRIISGGATIAAVRKALFSFRNRFLIDIPGPDDITVVGSFIEHEYSFYRNKQEIASVSRKYFRLTDTYGIEIKSNVDDLLVLCSAVVIDLCCHTPKKP